MFSGISSRSRFDRNTCLSHESILLFIVFSCILLNAIVTTRRKQSTNTLLCTEIDFIVSRCIWSRYYCWNQIQIAYIYYSVFTKSEYYFFFFLDFISIVKHFNVTLPNKILFYLYVPPYKLNVLFLIPPIGPYNCMKISEHEVLVRQQLPPPALLIQIFTVWSIQGCTIPE